MESTAAVCFEHELIEILTAFPRGNIRSALFDFDGTLSLIREGWHEVMIRFMVGVLQELNTGEPAGRLARVVDDFVRHLTGKQTIYQMLQLVEEIKRRGGTPEDPLVYKRRYHERLWTRIEGRIEALRSGQARPEMWLVPGSLKILENFTGRGVVMYLASGTDEEFVKEEARLLGLDRFFQGRIFGALDQYHKFSKKILIERILSDHMLRGSELVAFGDGYVEIENAKRAGGIAVGVASDESRRNTIDEWKRRRLIDAGADIIVPDFREEEDLVAYLFERN